MGSYLHVTAAAALAGSVLLSTPAHADNTEDPCSLRASFFCRFLPIAPDLDHDVDLSQGQPPKDWTRPSP